MRLATPSVIFTQLWMMRTSALHDGLQMALWPGVILPNSFLTKLCSALMGASQLACKKRVLHLLGVMQA